MLDMAESRRAQSQYRRSYLSIGDDLDAEDVSQSRTAVGTKGSEDEVLPLLIEDQNTAEHL